MDIIIYAFVIASKRKWVTFKKVVINKGRE